MESDLLQSEHCAELLRALGDPLRLRIIDLLRGGPKNVGEITAALDSDIVIVSHHLRILRNAGFVQKRRQGRFIEYRLDASAFESSGRENSCEYLNLGCCRIEIPQTSRRAPSAVAPDGPKRKSAR